MKEIESLLERLFRCLKCAEMFLVDGDNESSVSRMCCAMFFLLR
ncbi:MAG: hypothetical protein ACETWM_00430 [Candidatus Lokiarchaeia archaeon]